MPVIRIATLIRAPIEVCFDLARRIDLHVESMRSTGERAAGGAHSSASITIIYSSTAPA